MNFKYFYNKNILLSQADAILIPVNSVGVMGAGLAKQAADKYPQMVSKYKELCARRILQPGIPQLITYPRKIVLFPTKDHWRNQSSIEWIIKGLEKLKQQDGVYSSLAIPPLGCGLGGLKWSVVEKHIKEILKDSLCEVHIYCPKP